MKRFCAAVLAIGLILVGCAGCGNNGVDPGVKLGAYFTQYDLHTQCYGMERMAALEALGVDLQDVENISHNRWGFSKTDEYAGLHFAVSGLFRGKEYSFSGVYMEKSYKYPEDKTVFLLDTVKVCRQLTNDIGPATDTSYFFNWISAMMGEDWNRDIKFWQDPKVLERVVNEGYSGSLLSWDLSAVASQTVKNALGEAKHALVCSIQVSEENGTAALVITY